MNTTADRTSETRTENNPTPRAAAQAPAPEPFEQEATARPDASEFRETVERGYGWGV